MFLQFLDKLASFESLRFFGLASDFLNVVVLIEYQIFSCGYNCHNPDIRASFPAILTLKSYR